MMLKIAPIIGENLFKPTHEAAHHSVDTRSMPPGRVKDDRAALILTSSAVVVNCYKLSLSFIIISIIFEQSVTQILLLQ